MAAEDIFDPSEDLHLDPDAPIPPERRSRGPLPPWRVAKALETLRAQINEAFPGRNRDSDGTIGDERHRNRASDHNAHIVDDHHGVVSALDVTHDPNGGCDVAQLVLALNAARDPRIKYLIWNRAICSSYAVGALESWAWRAYTGSNPHTKHCHISVRSEKSFYDDTSPWSIRPPARNREIDAEPDAEVLLRNALVALSASPADASPLRALDGVQDRLTRLFAWAAEHASMPRTRGLPPDPATLRKEYLDLWEGCEIRQNRREEVAWHRQKLVQNRTRYEVVSGRTDVPWWFIGIVHALEASFSFTGHLHNGDPLSARTTNIPAGRPRDWNPPGDWESSAIDALEEAGNVRRANWSLADAICRFEAYNGFGYHTRGINSPYLWSFSNHYTAGKFVSDGVYSPTAVSRQCGAAVMLHALVKAGDIELSD